MSSAPNLNEQRIEALEAIYRRGALQRSQLPAQGFYSLLRDGLAAEQPSRQGAGMKCVLTAAGVAHARRLFAPLP